jgi:hypothetical protein
LGYDDSLDAFGVHGIGGFIGALLTGVFASALYFNSGVGNALDNPVGILAQGPLAQVGIQALAAMIAAVLAFVGSAIIVKVIDGVWGFHPEPRGESEGLDRTEHGEVGFDFGPTLEVAAELSPPEPRPAKIPPDGQKRFSVVVEGAKNGDLIDVWSRLCQTGPEEPPAEFLAVYPFMTTVQGNRFRFRGGDPNSIRDNLSRLLQSKLHNGPVNVFVEK